MSRMSIYKRHRPAVEPAPGNDGPGYWFAFSSGRLLVQSDGGKPGIPLLTNLEEIGIFPVRKQYLGTLDSRPCYSAEIPSDASVPQGMALSELRPLYAAMDEDIFILAGKAGQIVDWDRENQFCSLCGSRTEELKGERAKICPECGLTYYPRITPAVIAAVIKDYKILLTHNTAFPGNRHSLVAGFVEPGETLEECVKREVMEETGIEVTNIRYFSSQPWPFPNSIMIGFKAYWRSGEIAVDGSEITDAGWFDAGNLPEIPQKISIAREIIDSCLQDFGAR